MDSKMLAKLIPPVCDQMFYNFAVEQIWVKGRSFPHFHGEPLVLCPADFYFENKLEKSFRGMNIKPLGLSSLREECSFICL